MTIEETIDLLSVIGACDRRAIGEADAAAWHATIGDLNFADARQAVVAHYTESTEWIMPAHVRQRVRAMRRDRLARTPLPAPPAELTDEPGRYRDALTRGIRRLADGVDVRRAIDGRPREGEPPQEWAKARAGLDAAAGARDDVLTPQEKARAQAEGSRAARQAREDGERS